MNNPYERPEFTSYDDFQVRFATQSKRDRILLAAYQSFSKSGFQKTKISDVGKAAGVSSGSIYDYFEDKENLFFSVTDEIHRHFMEQIDLHLRAVEGAFNQLRKFIWIYIYFLEKNQSYAAFLLLEQRNMKTFFESDGYTYLKAGVRKLLNIIEEGQRSGEIRTDVDKYLIRHLVLGTLEHVVFRWILKDFSYPISDRSPELSALIESALRPGP
jgi:TetR/AcrR family fatty acid metabolism transcriptional regulator